MAQDPPLIKPKSEKGTLAILGPWGNLSIVDARTGQVIEQGRDSGGSNGRAATFRFSRPGSAYNGVVLVSDGQPISGAINLNARAFGSGDSFAGEAYRPDPGGAGDLSRGDVADPALADLDLLTFNPATFQDIDPALIEGVDPVDIFAIADQAGERNREQILNAFADARGVSREIIDEAREANKESLTDINAFNAAQQAEAFASLGPDAAKSLDQGISNLAAFSEGRLPDALENEILNQVTRANAAQQTNITGGGIGSSFGNRVAAQQTIQQRIGLQTSALNAAPSFLANALELRRGAPQKLVFNPNEEIAVRTGIAGQLSSASTLSPTAAIEGEFRNTANELNVQQFNANAENQGNQFNAQGQFLASQFNANALTSFQNNLLQYDLLNQRELQNYEQRQINTANQNATNDANIQTATQNADANIAANESAASNNAVQDTISGIGTAAGAVSEVIDTFTGGDSEDTGGGDTTVVVPPSETTGTTVNTSPTGSNGQPIIVPAPPSGAVGSVQNSDGTEGYIMPDGNEAIDYDSEIDNYEPIFTPELDAQINSSELSTSPVNYSRSITTPTSQNTRQLDAHMAARKNVSQMVDPTTLNKSQIQYQDGATGFKVDKPVTDLKKVIGPIPAAIVPDISQKRGNKSVDEMRAVTKAFNTAGKIPKPNLESLVWKNNNWNKEYKLDTLIPTISLDTEELGDAAFEAGLNVLDRVPIVNALPVDYNGEVIKSAAHYVGISLGDFVNSLEVG